MVDELHGKIRVRSWPKKRDAPRNPTNEFWSRWLRGATYVYRYSPAKIQWALQEATKGTVWMPRDVLISAMRGRAFLLQDENGRTYYPLAFMEDVSNSLDAIAQTPGNMLFRNSGLWVPVPPGAPGQVLTYVDDDTPPDWATPGGGAAYFSMMLYTQGQGSETDNINNTSYINFNEAIHWIDWDSTPVTEFQIFGWLGSSQAGVDVTFQYNVHGALASPLSATGIDCVFNGANSTVNGGWKTIVNRPSGTQKMGFGMKGGNSTVDLTHGEFGIMFR